jgi:hypothetical protein
VKWKHGGPAGPFISSWAGSVKRATDLLLDGPEGCDGLLVGQSGGDWPVGARSDDVAAKTISVASRVRRQSSRVMGSPRRKASRRVRPYALPEVVFALEADGPCQCVGW